MNCPQFPRCDDCGQLLRCETDWLGRMHYLHDQPCVARPVRHIRECTICQNEVIFEQQPSYRQKLFACSPRCEERLEFRRKLSIRQADERRRMRKREMAA